MNREDALIRIASLAVLLPSTHYQIGVLLPSYREVKRFNLELLEKFAEVPKWLIPKISRCTQHEIEFIYGRITLLHDARACKGIKFNSLYVSSILNEKQKSEYLFTLIPMLSNGNSIITFDDN